MQSQLHKVVGLLAVLVLAACANQDRFATAIPQALPVVEYAAPKTVFQSTQPISVKLDASLLIASDLGQNFSVNNITAPSTLIADTSVLKVGTQVNPGLSWRLAADMGLSFEIYPYADESLVTSGVNQISLLVPSEKTDPLITEDAFEVMDFNTVWYLGSNGSAADLSTFWIDESSGPTQASDGSSLILTGVGSAVLYR
jgi:hypothetical protein